MKRIKTLTALEVVSGMHIQLRNGTWGYVDSVSINDTYVFIALAGSVHIYLGASEGLYQLEGV